MRRLLVVLFALLTSTTAGADTLETLGSKEALEEAKKEIAVMSHPQLTLFADYLAKCENLFMQDITWDQCKIALMRYNLEYKRGTALDSVTHAMLMGTLMYRESGTTKSKEQARIFLDLKMNRPEFSGDSFT